MDMDTQKLLQLSQLLLALGGSLGGPNSAAGRLSASVMPMNATAIQAEAQKKAEKEAKKKEKSGMLGSAGSLLGAVALAPLTGGMSLMGAAATMGAGSMVGGMAGRALGGGSTDIYSATADALSGGAQGAWTKAMPMVPRGTSGQAVLANSPVGTPAPTPMMTDLAKGQYSPLKPGFERVPPLMPIEPTGPGMNMTYMQPAWKRYGQNFMKSFGQVAGQSMMMNAPRFVADPNNPSNRFIYFGG